MAGCQSGPREDVQKKRFLYTRKEKSLGESVVTRSSRLFNMELKGVFYLDLLLEHKWVILVSLEVLAWTSTFFLLYARYGLKSAFWFKVATVLFALTGVIPQVLMGIINFISTKRIDMFTLIIILLLVYGFTIGKQHIKKLDAWAQAKFSKQST